MIAVDRTEAEFEAVAPVTPGYMTRERAAAYCGVSVSTFDRYIRPAVARIVITPHVVRYRAVDLDGLLDRRREDPPLG
jgi:predicted DNA-binding protein (UPF0251 family)